MSKKSGLIVLISLLAIGLYSAGLYYSGSFKKSHFVNSSIDQNSIDLTPIDIRPVTKYSDYEDLWKEVDSLNRKGLYKSAGEKIDAIISKAKSEKNHPMIIKGYLSKITANSYTEEDNLKLAVTDLEQLTKETEAPSQQIAHLLLAKIYWGYYNSNRWSISQRTELTDYDKSDFKEWPKSAFVDKAMNHLYASLSDGEILKSTPIDDLTLIVNDFEYYNFDANEDELAKRMPTVYDLIAREVYGVFAQVNFELPRSNKEFVLDQEVYFADPNEFCQYSLPTFDSINPKYHALGILQDLTAFHLANNHTDALLDITKERLEFVYENSTLNNSLDLYYDAIDRMIAKFENHSISGEYRYIKAKHQSNLAKQYTPKNTEYQFKNIEALKICKQVQTQFPNSYGAKKCAHLENEIKNKSFNISGETYIIPNYPSRYQLSAKNIHEFFTKLIAIDFDEYQEKYTGYKKEEALLKKIRNTEAIYQTKDKCPSQKDFLSHTYEFGLPKLKNGFYLLVVSSSPDFESENESVKITPIVVTDLNLATRKKGNKQHFLVTSRTTGAPVKSARIKIWSEKYNYKQRKYIKVSYGSVETDTDGKATFSTNSDSRSFRFLVSHEKDILPESESFYLYKDYPPSSSTNTSFFTDRGIYRPGQKVYFKGIMIKDDGAGHKSLVKNQKATVYLKDPNYQKIKEIQVTTNEFGSYSGSFDLPVGRLNGAYRIGDANGSKSIRVEEYKRPKFETSFKTVENEFKLNDSVEVVGEAKAFAGNVIDGAEVAYTITRTTRYPSWGYRCWYWMPESPAVTISTGKTTSDENGEYHIKFEAAPDLKVKSSFQPTFNYQVTATVTDINGESHETSTNVRVGYTSMVLNNHISSSVDLNDIDSIYVTAYNLNGGKLDAKGKLTIQKLQTPSVPLRNSIIPESEFRNWTEAQFKERFPLDEYAEKLKNDWPVEKEVLAQKFETDKKIPLALKKWGEGTYKVVSISKDKDGNEIKDVTFFEIRNSRSKTVSSNEAFFVKRLNPEDNEPGDVAEILVGSAFKNINFLVEVEKKDHKSGDGKIISSKWYTNQKGQQIIEVPITEEDREGISVHLTMNKNARNYTQTSRVYVSRKDKTMEAELTSFRDKMLPGSKEKWTVSLKTGYGKEIAAEMLATMYDKSLDEFVSNYFGLNVLSYFYGYSRWNSQNNHRVAYTRSISHNFNKYVYGPSLTYPTFKTFGADRILRGRNSYYYKYRAVGNARGVDYDMVDGATETVALEESYAESPIATGGVKSKETLKDAEKKVAPPPPPGKPRADNLQQGGEGYGKDISVLDSMNQPDLSTVKARTNFSETAFFYPHLRTNDKGEITLEFTMPESLTKWKFMALAHSEDLQVGRISKEVVTQKELMVMPNAPRFLREGDIITISAKVSNLTKDTLKSSAMLSLINPFTEEDITSQFKVDLVQQEGEVLAGRSTSFSWNLKVPFGISAVAYKIVAAGGKHSDGERNTLPILSNRMLVTESMLMSVRKAGTHKYTFDKLLNNNSSSLKHHSLTLEFTENPAWYAIQAMPYMMEYPYECAEQTFTRYYSNSIATHIMNSNPKIKEVIESWKTESPEAFLSNLEKNQELKALILEETPWVLQAKDETQRKKNIALLFDLSRMDRELSKALNKTIQNQRHNGGWSWFPGMPENRYITQHIVSGLGHLKVLEVEHNDSKRVQRMTKKAIEFLDEKIIEDYNWMKRHQPDWETKNYISSTQIQYLYARSYFTDIEIPKNAKDAFDYYMNSSKKKWLQQSLYTQGMIALYMHRYDQKTVTKDIVKSLKERSIESKEFGRYWKELNNGGYYWYQAPIETQALMIELFDETTEDEEMVEDLKVWLLKQKQTTDWKTTKATAEACYALLLRGTDVLTTSNTLEIFLGDQKIVYDKIGSNPNEIGVQTQKGTGYFKHRFDGNEVKQSFGDVTIKKKANTVSWGSMYWQYWEDMDKITFHKTPLHLEKELFIVKNDGSGEKMVKVSASEVKVGDKVRVRIVLRSDRNLEFVHMKDMRASGFEPINVLSRYKYQEGLGYYESTKDASTNFFFDYIPKGTYVFEYDLRAQHKGDFSNGIASIQCMYAPEFTSHSNGVRVKIQ